MDTSVFTAKSKPPAKSELAEALGKSAAFWSDLVKHVSEGNAEAYEEWNFSKSFGWNCRVRDKKTCHSLPHAGQRHIQDLYGIWRQSN